MNRIFNPENKHKLDSEERRKLIPPEKILDLMNINFGETFLDVGAGTGYFALIAAKYVGTNGRVIAADVSQEMLDEIKLRSLETNQNIELLLCKADSINIGDSLADKILMAFVFHEIDKKADYLKEMYRVAKNNCELTIVEWEKVDSQIGPPINDRISSQDLIQIAESSGFFVIKHEKINPYQYLLIFNKKNNTVV